jgi:hypothetical protein
MYPSVFVSEAFFDLYDEDWCKWRAETNDITDTSFSFKEYTILTRIKDLLLHSNIFTDMKDKQIVKYFKIDPSGIETSFKQVFLKRIIKSASAQRKLMSNSDPATIPKQSICFFQDLEFEEMKSKARTDGCIYIGRDFLKSGFFLDCSFAVRSADQMLSPMIAAKHPCSSMVIIDQYLFVDGTGAPKIPRLIHLLNELISNDLSHPFEIDIITRFDEALGNSMIDKKYQQILEGLSERNISLHVYSSRHFQLGPDRYFLTNYSIYAVGHPWHQAESHISASFFPSVDVGSNPKDAFQLLSNKIRAAYQSIQNCPPHFGLLTLIRKSDCLEHRIFDLRHEAS